jgi:serine/threonine protein kinase
VIVDFGMSSRFAGRETREVMDVATSSGTAAFMSPEQMRGELVYARTDLVSLGAMLYRAVAHRPPFASAEELLAPGVLAQQLCGAGSGIPDGLDALCARVEKGRYLNLADPSRPRMKTGWLRVRFQILVADPVRSGPSR